MTSNETRVYAAVTKYLEARGETPISLRIWKGEDGDFHGVADCDPCIPYRGAGDTPGGIRVVRAPSGRVMRKSLGHN